MLTLWITLHADGARWHGRRQKMPVEKPWYRFRIWQSLSIASQGSVQWKSFGGKPVLNNFSHLRQTCKIKCCAYLHRPLCFILLIFVGMIEYCPACVFPELPSSPAPDSDKQGRMSLCKVLTLLHLHESSTVAKDYSSGKESPLTLWGLALLLHFLLAAVCNSPLRSACSRKNMFKWTEYQQQLNSWWSLSKYPHLVMLGFCFAQAAFIVNFPWSFLT